MKRRASTLHKEKIAIIGSGNCFRDEFEEKVNMWVYEEVVDGRKLSEIINEQHENKKYLPGIKLPENVVAVPDLIKAVQGASLLIFVLPHQFLKKVCATIKGNIPHDAKAISLIKGIEIGEEGPVLLSKFIQEELDISVCVLMGANIANEVANEVFSEATIGYSKGNAGIAEMWQRIFNISYFRVSIVEDIPGVEVSGALKNVVALAAGFVDGLGFAGNTKAAVIRIGLLEMRKFCRVFYHQVKDETFWESCGVADVIVTCFEGRNRRCAEAFVKTGKSFAELEDELLNGQKLQGTGTAEGVYAVLKKKNLLHEFPLFTAVYRIANKEIPPSELLSSV